MDTYNVDNLNEKLADIQNKLSDYIFQATGITVKKSKVKLKKVLGETIIEKKIIDSPIVQKEENTNNENTNLKNKNDVQNKTSPYGKEN